MKQLNYLLRMLWWNRGDTLVKMLSVGLGMAVSAFLFVRVAYDQSFDTCFKDYDNIMQLWMEYELDGKKLGRQEHCVGKLGGEWPMQSLTWWRREVPRAISGRCSATIASCRGRC